MSSKNAFLAFGLPPEDATVDTFRSDLAAAIARFLSDGKFSQKKAAELLGLSQATISNITRGNIEHLSIERLIRAMVRAHIPGWADWPSPEQARAGRGFFPIDVSGTFKTQRTTVRRDGIPAYLQPSDPAWQQWQTSVRAGLNAPNTYELDFDEGRKVN